MMQEKKGAILNKKERQKLKKERETLSSQIDELCEMMKGEEITVLEVKNTLYFSKGQVHKILNSDVYEKKWNALYEKSHLLNNSKDLLSLLDLNICIFPYL